MDRRFAILPWIGLLSATGSTGLATYIAFHPDIAGAYAEWPAFSQWAFSAAVSG